DDARAQVRQLAGCEGGGDRLLESDDEDAVEGTAERGGGCSGVRVRRCGRPGACHRPPPSVASVAVPCPAAVWHTVVRTCPVARETASATVRSDSWSPTCSSASKSP